MTAATKFALSVVFGAALAAAGGPGLALKDLPPAAQKTIREQTRGSRILKIDREERDGAMVYEVETQTQGRRRDLLVSSSGEVLEIEQEVEWNSVPPAAREALARKAAGGKIVKVEQVARNGRVIYEASIRRQGKTEETEVTANGEEAR